MRRIGAAVAVAAAVAAGVVAVDQAGGAAAPAAGVQSVTTPADRWSAVWPRLSGLTAGPTGGNVVFHRADGPATGRWQLLRSGAVTDLAGPASIQGAVVAVATAGTVAFQTIGGGPLGSVALAAGETSVTQLGAGALVAVPAAGRLTLVRRAPGAADVPLAGGAAVDAVRAYRADADGALLEVTDGTARTVRYLDLGTGALTPLTAAPVQGVVFEPTRVGWIAGATLTTAPRATPTVLTPQTLPVATAEFVSGNLVAWREYRPVERATYLRVRSSDGPSTYVAGRWASTGPGDAFDADVVVLPGGFLYAVNDPSGGGFRINSGAFTTFVQGTITRTRATVGSVSISGGRVAYTDDSAYGGQALSAQVRTEDGLPRLDPAVPVGVTGPPTAAGSPGTVAAYARGTRTVLLRTDGRPKVYGGTTAILTSSALTLDPATRITGQDGTSLVTGSGADTRLVDTRTGQATAVPPSDLDAGHRWYAGTTAGSVLRVAPGSAPQTVLPAGTTCPAARIEARQGDLLVVCTDGRGQLYGPTGTRLLEFAADDRTHLGTGLLWRYDQARNTVTATAYGNPGAAPVDVLRPDRADGWAVDREAPYAAEIGTDGRVRVALVPGAPVPPPATLYTPVTAYRLLDTRTTGGPVVAGADRSVPVTGVPAGVVDVAVSITVVRPSAAGWLAAYPDGRYGGSSTVNFAANQTVTTLAVVPVRNGRIALRMGVGSAHVVLDVVGYHAAVSAGSSARQVALAPTRVLDTRTSGPVVAGSPRTVPIPSPGWAAVLTVTVARPTTASWLSVSTDSTTTPTTVSFGAGQTTASLAVVPRSRDGSVTLQVGAGQADVLLDLVGYVATIDGTETEPADFFASGPTRLLDTRTGAGTPVAAGADLRVPVAGTAGVPRNATAVLVTATAVRGTASGYLTVYPTGTAPATSTLNYTTGQTVANAALVPIGPDGSISVKVGAGTAHVLLDVAGYLQR